MGKIVLAILCLLSAPWTVHGAVKGEIVGQGGTIVFPSPCRR